MGCRDPGSATCTGTHTASATGVMALSVSFFDHLVAGYQKASLAQSFSIAPPIQVLRGLPCLGSFSIVWYIRHIVGPPWLGSYTVDQ